MSTFVLYTHLHITLFSPLNSDTSIEKILYMYYIITNKLCYFTKFSKVNYTFSETINFLEYFDYETVARYSN